MLIVGITIADCPGLSTTKSGPGRLTSRAQSPTGTFVSEVATLGNFSTMSDGEEVESDGVVPRGFVSTFATVGRGCAVTSQ